jgi:hypothetical protein
MRRGLQAFFALVLSAGAATKALAQPTPVRSEVPIREVILSDGTRRYGVPITIGAQRVEAGLDSGSTGLRVLPGPLGSGDTQSTGRDSRYSYSSGAELRGTVGRAKVSIGAATGSSTLELVSSIGCSVGHSGCPASRVPLADYGVQGDGLKGEGFKAILGINMGEAEVDNPLRAIGVQRWIIELPLPGSGRPGRLVLNPTAEETAEYRSLHVVPLPANVIRGGGMHDGVLACLQKLGTRLSFCGPTLLDTGAPGIEVANATGAVWPNNTEAALAFFGDHEKPATYAAFVIGERKFASRLVFIIQPPAGKVRLYPGLAPYFAYDVLYDPGAGVVGLKPRPDTEMVVR